MNERIDLAVRAPFVTRRRAICGVALSFGSLATVPLSHAQVPKGANGMKTSLHQEIEFKAPPRRIYEALLDAKQFTALSGVAAEIDPKAGGAFSLFEGQIVGRTVELLSGRRIVQAWRSADWKDGDYSIVHFEMKASPIGTMLILGHAAFPVGEYDSLSSGWYEHYWEPLKKFVQAG